MKYCTHCGKEIMDEAVICMNCGCQVKKEASIAEDVLVNDLSSRLKTNGVIWICIASIQILAGIAFDWILLIIGVLNIISAINDLTYSKTVLDNPTAIVKRFEPLTGAIIVLIYNLIFGGIIGVIGSVYYLTAIRGFVVSNKTAFLQIEEKYSFTA